MDTKPKTLIQAATAELVAAAAEARARIAMLRKYRKQINRVFAPLAAAHKAGVLRYEPNITVSGKDEAWWKVIFTAYVSTVELDGFKDERLTKLLAKLIHADETKTRDYAESLNRDFEFRFSVGETAEVQIVVQAYVKSDSPTCRKVLKSTKTEVVERKEYEIVCS